MLRMLMAVLALAATTAAAQADWGVSVAEKGDVRSTMLVGYDLTDPYRQFAILCVTQNGEARGEPILTIGLAPVVGSVARLGDPAELTVTAGGQSWTFAAEVTKNDSEAFGATLRDPAGIVIGRLLESDAPRVQVGLVSEDVEVQLDITETNAAAAAAEFLAGCGTPEPAPTV